MIGIVDYGMGNVTSVKKALTRIGVQSRLTSDPSMLSESKGLILPGVGHFSEGMSQLDKSGLSTTLKTLVLQEKMPILGICLGMQLLTNYSEEGDCNGLGLVNASTVKFPITTNQKGYKIPHIGWNSLEQRNSDILLKGIGPDEHFYFVHSYFITSSDNSILGSMTHYGVDLISTFENENIYGTQFHPEKSHDQGLNILKNFCDIAYV